MADQQTHIDIIKEFFDEAEREIKLMQEHGHSSDDTILKGIMSIKLILEKMKKVIVIFILTMFMVAGKLGDGGCNSGYQNKTNIINKGEQK